MTRSEAMRELDEQARRIREKIRSLQEEEESLYHPTPFCIPTPPPKKSGILNDTGYITKRQAAVELIRSWNEHKKDVITAQVVAIMGVLIAAVNVLAGVGVVLIGMAYLGYKIIRVSHETNRLQTKYGV